MIRQPKRPPSRCACGRCETCADPLVQQWNDDRRLRNAYPRTADLAAGHGRRTVNVPRHAGWADHQPKPRLPDLTRHADTVSAFDAHMDRLRRRLRGGPDG